MHFHARRISFWPHLAQRADGNSYLKKMKTYELSYIVSSEVPSENAEAKAKEIESAIQSREGVILKQLNPVAKTLAFPVGKRASGFFGTLEFQIEPEKLLEVKELVAKDKQIVRHMLLIKEPARIRKARRVKPGTAVETEPKLESVFETKREIEPEEEPTPATKPEVTKEKEKVDLKDIDQQLDEILG